jgi:hypothetical protein
MPHGALAASGLQGAEGCGVRLICQRLEAVWFDESDPAAWSTACSSGSGLKLRKTAQVFNNAGTVSWIAGCHGE